MASFVASASALLLKSTPVIELAAFAYNATPAGQDAVSPFEAMYGQAPQQSATLWSPLATSAGGMPCKGAGADTLVEALAPAPTIARFKAGGLGGRRR